MTLGNSNLIPAPFWRRFFAYSIDLTIVSFFLFLGMMLVGLLTMIVLIIFGMSSGIMSGDSSGSGLIGVLIFVLVALAGLLVLAIIYHGYFVHFESKDGVTPGKKVFGLAVRTMDGGIPSSTQCLTRDMFRYFDCLLVLPGLLAFVLSKQRRRVGDLVANTMVIHDPRIEAAIHHIYLTQEVFEGLKKPLAPRAVPADVAEQYLSFAFPRFISQEPIVTTSDEEWKQAVLPYLNQGSTVGLSDEIIFRFFAECCAENLRDAR